MDEAYRVSDFKTEHKKMYLFGVSRKLKENIYFSGRSPEVYLHDGNRASRIELPLQAIRSREYRIDKYVFPANEAILSSTIHDNKVYILAHHFLTNQQHVLYEGDLNATSEVIANKRLLLDRKYTFQEASYRL